MNSFILSLFVLFFGACFNTNLNCKIKMMEPDGAASAAAAAVEPLIGRIKGAINLYNDNYPDDAKDLEWYKAFLRTKLGIEINDDGEKKLETIFKQHYGDKVDLKAFIKICELDDIIAFLVLFYSTDMKVLLQRLILSYEMGDLAAGHNAEPYKFLFLNKAESIFKFLVKCGAISSILIPENVVNALQIVLLDKDMADVSICIVNPVEMILEIMPGVTLSQLKSIQTQIDEINHSNVAEDRKKSSINHLIFFLNEHDRSAILGFLNTISTIKDVLYQPGVTYSIAPQHRGTKGAKVSYKNNDDHLLRIASSTTPKKLGALRKLDTDSQLKDALQERKVGLIAQLTELQSNHAVMKSDLIKSLKPDITIAIVDEHVTKNVPHGSILESHYLGLAEYLRDPGQIKGFVELYNKYVGNQILIDDTDGTLGRLSKLQF